MAFILRVIGEILDDLEGMAELCLSTNPRSGEGDPGQANGKVAHHSSRSRAWQRAAAPTP